MHKLRKALIVLVSSLIVIAVIVIALISPITKYLIQKYDLKYSGREITLDWAYVNPFTGYIHFSNLKIYELKSDSIFFSSDGISANFEMLKLLSKTYEISDFKLNHPRGIIIQNRKDFNFNDLIEKFAAKQKPDSTLAPVHFNILGIKITNGEFYYREQLIPINYFIKKVSFESSGKRWNADTIAAKFSFLSGIGSGEVKGNFTINLISKEYRTAVLVHKFNLNIIEQYLKDLTNYGSFAANLDADIKAKGNLNNEENVTVTGMMAIDDFHFGKNPTEDFVSFKKFVLLVDEVSPLNHTYLFDSLTLVHPYFKYERYDSLDNVQTMFGKNGDNIVAAKTDPEKFNLIIEIADYIKVLSKNFFKSDYRINRIAINNGDVNFNDYTGSEKFSIDLTPLSVAADSVDKNHQRVAITVKSDVKPYGNILIAISINPKDSSDFDMQYHFQHLPVSMFNPYLIKETSFPVDRGTLEFNGKWNVQNGMIKSINHLVVIDPRLTTRLKNKDTKWIPMRLLIFFVRERGNVIDYEIPITGNLKDPKFHLHDVILTALENIFVKPATSSYISQVRNTENEIEKSIALKWKMRNNSLEPKQQKFVERIAEFLSSNPEASINVRQQIYSFKEKEYILLFEGKKKYYLQAKSKSAGSFSKTDSIDVNKMSVKDVSFGRYLNKQTNDSLLFTVQEKCSRIVDSSIVNAKYKQLIIARKNTFMTFFKDKKVENQITFSVNENVIPYNGFSFYKIDYKGNFPESLLNAYRKMNDLNNEIPRKKYKIERKKNKNAA